MNPFGDYEKTDISNVVLNEDFFKSLEESEEHLLLDMDSLVHRKEDMMVSRIMYDSTKKCFLGEPDESSGQHQADWSSKPLEHWTQSDTINWLMATAAPGLGMDYGLIPQALALPGHELASLERADFVARDALHGERLYELLMHHQGRHHDDDHNQHHHHRRHHHHNNVNDRGPLPGPGERRGPEEGWPSERDLPGPGSDETFQKLSIGEDEPSQAGGGSNNVSDAESDNSIEVSTKRPPGRPRILKTKKTPTSQGKLWEFIRDLLRNRKTCPSLICWEDYSQAKFRFVRSDEVAKLWGSRKGNTKMTYEKLSRAMRYYYKRKIFLPVLGRRLVYQFGPNATGWQTDNPNFRF